MQKKYSVLMSVYINEKPQYLREAINSMLNQTLKLDEFVIIQDGNLTKELEAVIEEYKNKYKNLFNIIKIKENVGLGEALAIGVRACKNEYIARMDSDDIATKERCEKEIKMLNENPNIDVVGSIVAEFNMDINNITGYRILPEKNKEIQEFAKKRNPCAHSSIIMKKSKVLAVGNYKGYLYFEDYDLWIRMIRNGCQFYNIQDVLIYMRAEEEFYKRRGRYALFKTNA